MAIPINVEHYVTMTGNVMTRIRFIITSGSSIVLGSNIEPLAPMYTIYTAKHAFTIKIMYSI